METRSSLQRRSHSETSDRLVANIKPRLWGEPPQPQAAPLQPTGHDLSQVDLHTHDPGSRPYPGGNWWSQPRAVQAKLTVGAPNDRYEQEADRVAEQVLSMPDAATHQAVQREDTEDSAVQTKPLAVTITPIVQREMAPEEKDEDHKLAQPKLIQRDEALKEEDEDHKSVQAKSELQRKASPASFQAQPRLEQQLDSSKGGGSPLPDNVRAFMEPRFGADFSQVRVHTGNEAVQMNQDLNAQAFTHKQNVYFGAGKAPGKDALTAHELTHVVQQTGGGQTKQTPKKPDVQLKCSACNEEEKVQRSTEASSVSEMRVQRSWFGDDDEKKEPESSSGGGVLDWAKEKVGGAVDSVSQVGGAAVDWAKEKGSGAVDTVTQAGGDAYDWAKKKRGEAVDSVTQAGGNPFSADVRGGRPYVPEHVTDRNAKQAEEAKMSRCALLADKKRREVVRHGTPLTWTEEVENFFCPDASGIYCRYGSAIISTGLDVSGIVLSATGAGLPEGVALFSLGAANNLYSAKVCGTFNTSLASTALGGIGLVATVKKAPVVGNAASVVDIALNLGPIVYESETPSKSRGRRPGS